MFVCVQAQLTVSGQEIQEMIRQRIRKMEEIKMSVTQLEVGPTPLTLQKKKSSLYQLDVTILAVFWYLPNIYANFLSFVTGLTYF